MAFCDRPDAALGHPARFSLTSASLAPQSQNLTHSSICRFESLSNTDGQIDSTGRKMALASMLLGERLTEDRGDAQTMEWRCWRWQRRGLDGRRSGGARPDTSRPPASPSRSCLPTSRHSSVIPPCYRSRSDGPRVRSHQGRGRDAPQGAGPRLRGLRHRLQRKPVGVPGKLTPTGPAQWAAGRGSRSALRLGNTDRPAQASAC